MRDYCNAMIIVFIHGSFIFDDFVLDFGVLKR